MDLCFLSSTLKLNQKNFFKQVFWKFQVFRIKFQFTILIIKSISGWYKKLAFVSDNFMFNLSSLIKLRSNY